ATAPTSVTTSSFIANWNIVSNVSQYQVDVSTTDTFTSFVGVYNSHAVTTNSLLVSGLLPGVNYYYRIRALNASGVSANSLVILALTRPEAPVATAATSINSTSFTANWGAVSSATSYLIDVSTISTFSTYVGSYNGYPVVVGNSIQIAGLTAATTYYFRVRAINSTGSSVVSNTVTVTTLSVSACAGYTFGGPSNACLNSPTSYFIFGGNPSGCSISTVTGTAASFSGSAVTFFAPGTYTVSFNCLCGTINQTVSVQTGTVTAGVLSRTTATFCSGSIPPETTLSNFSSFVSGWQKKNRRTIYLAAYCPCR
ncbi:MAG: fibronectin type III domain-containing protein, partial [bacterium]